MGRKKLDEPKNVQLPVRITEFQKSVIDDYCKATNQTVSEFVLNTIIDKIVRDKLTATK